MLLNEAVIVVAEIECADDMDTVRHAVRGYAGRLGYDRFVLYSATADASAVVDRLDWIEGDWFGEGRGVDEKTYLARCPITRHILESDEPFFWSKSGGAGRETYRVVRVPRGSGIHGLQVSIFGPGGLTGAMSFGGTRIDSSVGGRLSLTLIGMAALRTARRLIDIETSVAEPRITPREREILRWVASGRKQSDIALLLGLSERTIENHLRRIRLRLGVTSTAQAILASVKAGELGI